MNKMKIRHQALVLLLLFVLSACSKEENGDIVDPGQSFSFLSLTAEKYTISPGESTKITAIATGYLLRYKWSASAGNILNSGSIVTYAASPCNAGTNKITCTVTDGNNVSQSKEVSIVVQ
jgi:hypothetical protein